MSAERTLATQQARYTLWRRFARDFLLRTLAFHTLVRLDVRGLDHILPAGPTIVIINHLSAIDPVVMIGVIRPRFVVPMSKIENFRIPLVGWLMRRWGIYSVRRGEVDRTAIQTTIDLVNVGTIVLIAPEGTRQPAMIKAKDGLAYLATRTNAAVVPIGIDGTREFMHNLKHLQRTRITIRCGRAFRFHSRATPIPRVELATMTQEAMYQLAALLPEQRRGVYSDLSKMTTDTLELL